MTEQKPFTAGDKIVIDPSCAPKHLIGVVFEVERVNPKNVIARPVNGGRGINYPKGVLLHFEGEMAEDGTARSITVPLPELFVPGEIVTFKRPPAGVTTESPLVVTGGRGDKTNVSILGDDSGRYWRSPQGSLVKRDLAWLAKALAAQL